MVDVFDILDKFLKNNFVGELTVEVVSFRLLLAVIFGGIVGYEREKNNRPAGFRTYCFNDSRPIEIKYFRISKS